MSWGSIPHKRGPSRVWVVNCKSWQSGFNVRTKLEELKQNKIVSGRESWRFFRELMVPKWSEGFRDTVLRETGLRAFTYVTAVTRLSGDRSEWEQLSRFRKAMGGNPIRLLPLSEDGCVCPAPLDEDTRGLRSRTHTAIAQGLRGPGGTGRRWLKRLLFGMACEVAALDDFRG